MSTSAERTLYLDASALVKLVVVESESPALRALLAGRPALASCALSRVEVVRAVAPHGAAARRTADVLLDTIDLVVLDDELLGLAAELDGRLRSLDAIHLAAALELGDELEALVTYDERMTAAAQALGVPALAPC